MTYWRRRCGAVAKKLLGNPDSAEANVGHPSGAAVVRTVPGRFKGALRKGILRGVALSCLGLDVCWRKATGGGRLAHAAGLCFRQYGEGDRLRSVSAQVESDRSKDPGAALSKG